MFTIRLATQADAARLPAIEKSAGEAFLALPDLAWIAADGVQSEDRHRQLIESGAAWVAAGDDGEPVGFLSAEQIGRNLHVWEVSVLRGLQGQGLGRALIEAAAQWAKARHLNALTLTTFRDVPWNEPFYRRLGFRTLDADELTPELSGLLREEARNGLPGDKRCAMMLRLD